MIASFPALTRLLRRRSLLVKAFVNSPVAFGLMAIALLAGGWNYLVAESSRDRVAEANGTLLEVERLFSSVKDLQTAERGYVLVGGDRFLTLYDSANEAIDGSLKELRQLTHGHLDAALAGGPSLESLVARKRAFASNVVAVRKEKGFEAATDLVRTGEGEQIMTALRDEAHAIRDTLDERVARVQRSDRLRGLLLALLTGATSWSAVALLALVVFARRDEARRAGAVLAAMREAPVGLGILDRDMTLLESNPALGKLGVGAATGAPIWEGSPGLEAALSQPLAKAIRGVATPDIAIGVPADQGSREDARPLRVSVYPVGIPDAEGRTRTGGIGLVAVPG